METSKPYGTPRKLANVSRLRDLGWSSKIDRGKGIMKTYIWYHEHAARDLGERTLRLSGDRLTSETVTLISNPLSVSGSVSSDPRYIRGQGGHSATAFDQ